MKTIKLNGKKIDLSIAEERALRILRSYDFAAPRDVFEEMAQIYSPSRLPRGGTRGQCLDPVIG